MSNINDSIANLNQFQVLNEQISAITQSMIPTAAIMSSTMAMLNEPLARCQNTIRASIDIALASYKKSISDFTQTMNLSLTKSMSESFASIIKLQSESFRLGFEPIYKSINESAKLMSDFWPSYIGGVTSQWRAIIENIPNYSANCDVSLDDDITANVTEIIAQTVPEESAEKNELLSKIKGKMSISDLIALIGILVSILIFICGQISSNAEQKAIEKQSEAVIEETQEAKKLLEENERYQEGILTTIQQLTDAAQSLEELAPSKRLEDKQEN